MTDGQTELAKSNQTMWVGNEEYRGLIIIGLSCGYYYTAKSIEDTRIKILSFNK